jgi:hypothetical protein
MKRFQWQWLGWVVMAVAFAAFTFAAWAQRPAAPAQKGTRIQGHVVRVQGSDRIVVRTADKREVILHTNPQTRFLLNERVARFADLREGVEINALFDVMGERNLASAVTIIPAATPAADIVEGTIVRVIEPDNQIVVRTAAGKEVILLADERTKLTMDDRSVRLADFRPGTAVRVHFDVRNQKNMARSVMTMPKRPR